MISAGELHDWSWAARGCSRRFFPVLLSYSSKAASKIDWKLEEGVESELMDSMTWDGDS